ncbi:MAG: DUF1080 domain-containing protein [Pirellulales bacterium]
MDTNRPASGSGRILHRKSLSCIAMLTVALCLGVTSTSGCRGENAPTKDVPEPASPNDVPGSPGVESEAQAAVISPAASQSVPDEQDKTSSTQPENQNAGAKQNEEGTPLFDGKSLEGWKVSDFAGHGEVRVENGQLILPWGEALTGVTSTRELPTEDYEIHLEAMRVDGSDFFCGLTFPVGDDPASLILGGWGGTVVGVSSINGSDASENETTKYMNFDTGNWYAVRLRVTEPRIEAWIGEEKVVELERAGREFSIRPEVELSRPLGIASWQTTAALRNIRLISLADEMKP